VTPLRCCSLPTAVRATAPHARTGCLDRAAPRLRLHGVGRGGGGRARARAPACGPARPHALSAPGAGAPRWQACLRSRILAVGIDSAWNDHNEYELWDEDAACAGFGRRTPVGLARPLLALLMTRASYEVRGRLSWRRCWGGARRGGCGWRRPLPVRR